jgi:photosystem II stability/assembly factor-like uncharacterized protein
MNTPYGDYIMVIFESKQGTLFCSSQTGLFKATEVYNWDKIFDKAVRCAEIDFSGNIYIGTSEGLFESIDNGITWKQIQIIELCNSNINITDIKISSEGDIFIVSSAVDERCNGVFRRLKNQMEWKKVYGSKGYTTLAIQSNSLYLVDQGTPGLLKSTDNGDTWNYSDAGLPTYDMCNVDASPSGKLFAGTVIGLYSSLDSGKTWQMVSTLNNTYVYVTARYAKNGIIHCYGGGVKNSLFISKDDGETWSNVSDGLPLYTSVLYRTTTGILFAGSRDGVYKSSNYGSIWEMCTDGIPTSGMANICFNSNNDIFLISTGHLWKSSDDTKSWTSIYYSDYLKSLAIDHDDNIFVSTDDGIFMSNDNGMNWVKTSNRIESKGYSSHLQIGIDNEIYLIAALDNTFREWIYCSTDKGYTWKNITANLIDPNPSSFYQFQIKQLLQIKKNHLMITVPERLYFFTTDNGEHWTQTTSDKIALCTGGGGSLAITPDSTLFYFYTLGYSFISNDFGTSWDYYQKLPEQVSYFCSDPNEKIIVINDHYGRTYFSANDGSSWTEIVNDPNVSVKNQDESYNWQEGLLFDREGFLWIHYSYENAGLFRGKFDSNHPIPTIPTLISYPNESLYNIFSNASFNWKNNGPLIRYQFQISEGWPGTFNSNTTTYTTKDTMLNIVNLKPDKSYNWRLRAFDSYYPSAWTPVKSFKTSNILEVSDDEDLPKTFILHQNFPNPFNPSTVISYSLPKAANTKITIYNILGQKLTELVNKYEQAGNYKVTFNPQNLPSGVYIFSLHAGEYHSQKKMIYLK